METNKYSFVSSFEAFILALFDGTRTINDIVNNFKMLKNCPTEKEIQNDIYNIIQTRTELIELVKTPLKKGRVKLDPYAFLLKQNIFLKPSRASAPLAVDLYVTRRCNLNCVYCFANAKHVVDQNSNASFPEMSLDKINLIIDQIVQLEIKKILITGGEPTLGPELTEIIRHLTSHDIEVLLATNAYSMSDGLAKKLQDSGLKELQVKLDSTNPEMQDKLSGVKGSYGKLIKGIKTLKKGSFKISIASVATSWNIRDIPEVIKLGVHLGIKDFRPRVYTPGIWALQGRGGSLLNPSCNSILWLEKKIKQLQETYKDAIKISPVDSSVFRRKKENEVPGCPGMTSNCAILERNDHGYTEIKSKSWMQ